ncbi:ABC transporter substrate-binding protein [Glutamicibacter sp. BW80]|uniref:transporter substrate-binding domain-containing protein n=1 Tax=Glutamicibacter sp. BW80 TaxID=2024404 RepID=UPI000BB7A0F3|nr:transporter substrate-binding domain-containing protein [Glutamicibacter sp. BW80]PCC28606.1 ABC transporter substrate-binding protein [Glutamicibacter sp. BW80]
MTKTFSRPQSVTRLLPVFALGAVLLTTGCSTPNPGESNAAAPAATDTRLASVSESGILKVCTTGDYRPFTYLDPDTGEWSGIDITMAKDLAESLDVEAEFVQTTWKDLMPDFLSKCDIGVGGVSISMERAQQAYYSEATLDEGKTPITLCENVEKYDTVKEINKPGVRSITPIGGTNEKFAEANYPEGEIIRFEDNNTIFDEIIAGRADVMTTDASETRWVANEHPELCAVHPDKPFNFSQKAYLLPLGDDEFQEYVDQWLNMAKNDGTLAAAEKPWFG